MNDDGNIVQFPIPTQTECPSCTGRHVASSWADEEFTFGADEAQAQLHARILIYNCPDCGFSYTTDQAEVARHEAVCRHLQLLMPREILAIREGYGLTRSDFAAITRIGAASLQRWEKGQLLQNAANDSLLFLLRNPQNLAALERRFQQNGLESESSPQFRALSLDDQRHKREEGRHFRLRSNAI